MQLEAFLYFLPGFVIGFTVHESAHALVSKWLGDRLAESQGRISINPMRHLSPLGTVMMFIAGFGWGRPVPVNLYNYKKPKFYYLLSSLAGPASNLALCGLALLGMYAWVWLAQQQQITAYAWQYRVFYWGWMFLYSVLNINLILAVFNLMPIPPLDGSKIWPCLIPGMRPVWTGKATWLWFIILIIMMKGNVTSKIISPVINIVDKIVPTSFMVGPKEKELPENYPALMEAPDGAYYVQYYNMDDPNSNTCSYQTYYMLDEPYPAIEFGKELDEKLTRLGWSEHVNSMVPDPNNWLASDIEGEIGNQYRNLSYKELWKKGENEVFRVEMSYIADPNTLLPEDSLSVVYRYNKTE